jgi:hypothetical protein
MSANPSSLPFMGRDRRRNRQGGAVSMKPNASMSPHTSPPWTLRVLSLPIKGREEFK